MTKLLKLTVNSLYLVVLASILFDLYQYFYHLFSGNELFVSIASGRLTFSDFVLFHLAGRMAASVDAQHVYDPQVQLKWFNLLLSPWHLNKPFYFQDMPFVFPLMIPLSMLPLKQAFITWLIACLSVGISGLCLLLHKISKLSTWRIAMIVLGVFASFPALVNIFMGQQAWFLLGITCFYFWALLKRRHILAGVFLAFTSFKPHYSLFFAVPAFSQRRWQLIAVAAASEGLLFCLAGFTIGWQNVISYPRILLYAESTKNYLGVAADKMISARGILSLLFPQSAAVPISFVVMALGLVATYFIWRKISSQNSVQESFAVGLTVLLCLLTSPHSHIYDLLLLAILAITLSGCDVVQSLRLRPLSLCLWNFLLLAFPLLSWSIPALAPLADSLPVLMFFALNLTLFCCGIKFLMNQQAQAEGINDIDGTNVLP